MTWNASTYFIFRVGIGSVLEKQLDKAGLLMLGSQVQRRIGAGVRRLHVDLVF